MFRRFQVACSMMRKEANAASRFWYSATPSAKYFAFSLPTQIRLSDEVKKAAALKFSMGRITMPHQLARLVLTEQIYRACTINAGMRYHK